MCELLAPIYLKEQVNRIFENNYKTFGVNYANIKF